MPAWFDQDEPVTESAQPCGCDPGCKPKPHLCADHQAQADMIEVLERARRQVGGLQGVLVDLPEDARTGRQVEDYPQDASAASSVLGDTCPRCGGQLDYDEVDIGVGTLRGNPGCPDCHWVPGQSETPVTCPRCGTPGDQDDCRECHPTRPRQ